MSMKINNNEKEHIYIGCIFIITRRNYNTMLKESFNLTDNFAAYSNKIRTKNY